jgi:3-phenylpropionate/trans-cinnamate dioxygenase ferredoxin reductase subunit
VSDQRTFVIVGAGLAGAKAAETLRADGFAGRVLLIGAEPEAPYERPPLSKQYLAGSKQRRKLDVHEPGWYAAHEVELLVATRAVGLAPAVRAIRLGSGDHVGYDKLLLTTGASPKRLDLPGGGLSGVHYLRTVTDSDTLRAELADGGRRVVVVGGGWIGLETAAAARGHGNQVTVVEPQPVPLLAALGPELGAVFAELHREHGVDLRLRTGVAGFRGAGGRVVAVRTDRGEIPADVVIVGVGARPNTELAEGAGLAVDNGVVVDAALRTSNADVFAAGDVANVFSPRLGRHLRVEHWSNALHGGAAAARSMLGGALTYAPVPYFFTDQYDLGMEYAGYAAPGAYDRIVYRGDVSGRRFVAFWLAGDRVVAGMNVNVWDVTEAIQRLVRDRVRVDPDRLGDANVPLDQVAAVQDGVA